MRCLFLDHFDLVFIFVFGFVGVFFITMSSPFSLEDSFPSSFRSVVVQASKRFALFFLLAAVLLLMADLSRIEPRGFFRCSFLILSITSFCSFGLSLFVSSRCFQRGIGRRSNTGQ